MRGKCLQHTHTKKNIKYKKNLQIMVSQWIMDTSLIDC